MSSELVIPSLDNPLQPSRYRVSCSAVISDAHTGTYRWRGQIAQRWIIGKLYECIFLLLSRLAFFY